MACEDHDQHDSRPQSAFDGARRRRIKIAMVVVFVLLVLTWWIIELSQPRYLIVK